MVLCLPILKQREIILRQLKTKLLQGLFAQGHTNEWLPGEQQARKY